jgi:hypothetical protein
MGIPGTVEQGVIVLAEGQSLPEGTQVVVFPAVGGTEAPREPETDRRTIGQKLADLGRQAEKIPCNLPEDLAINHDHYLYGRPKRK